MPVPDARPAPGGTTYGGHPPPRPGPPKDPLMRGALAVGLVGVLLGVFFATGVLGRGDEPPAPTAAVTPTPAATGAQEPSPTVQDPSPTPTAAPSSSAPAQVTGPRVFRAVASDLCLGVDGDGEKAKAELAGCTGGPEQQWVVNPHSPDTVTLTNAAHGHCLDVEGRSGDDGAKIQQFGCHGETNQQWRLAPADSGAVLLVAAHSGRCAQPKDGGTEDGDEIRQAACTGAATQQWKLA